jgi:tetratricopeptide (TPR) repeat protein
MYFYMEEYDFAIKAFEKAFEIKNVNVKYYKRRDKLLEHNEEEKDEAIKTTENDFIENAELYEFFNTSFNIYEHYHNLIICYILSKQIKKAIETIIILEEMIPEPFKPNLEILRKLCEIEIGLHNKLKNSGIISFFFFIAKFLL